MLSDWDFLDFEFLGPCGSVAHVVVACAVVVAAAVVPAATAVATVPVLVDGDGHNTSF